MSILDIGCGNGSFIKVFIDAGIQADYFASDLSYKIVIKAKNNLPAHDRMFFVGDGFLIPVLSSLKFDVIHMISVLHHLIESTSRKVKCL